VFRRLTLGLAVTTALAILAVGVIPASALGATTGTAVDLLPDMRMAKLYGLDLETTSRGRVRLHFGTIGWNLGDGPLEARGRRDSGDSGMQVRQHILRSDGTWRGRMTPAVMTYAGDGHDHWHIRQFMTVALYRPDVPGGDVYGLRKLGYCLLDAVRKPTAPPNSPTSRVYPGNACGTQSSLTVRTGLSVGWGDDYPPYFAFQWMDITGLAAGVYRLCSTVDPHNDFLETNEVNNQRWTDVQIDIASDTVAVVATGQGACAPPAP
jgi:hypothetical protein